MIGLLKWVSSFADRSTAHSWLVHALGALLLCPLVGAFPVLVAFVLRESEQFVHARFGAGGEPWYDYVFDVMWPALVCAVWAALGNGNVAAWLWGVL